MSNKNERLWCNIAKMSLRFGGGPEPRNKDNDVLRAATEKAGVKEAKNKSNTMVLIRLVNSGVSFKVVWVFSLKGGGHIQKGRTYITDRLCYRPAPCYCTNAHQNLG